MADQKVVDYLEQNHVSYACRKHEPAFTAQEVAENAHISGHSLAKTVVVKLDGNLALCILPAAERVNFSQLRYIAGSHTAELASEDEFLVRFNHCEPGSLPPFGELFNLPVYAVGSLGSQPSVAVNSGDSSELLLLAWQDFEGLVKPMVLMEQQKLAIG